MNGDENILAERMVDDALSTVGTAPGKKHCALLWDESFLWGIMAWRALQDAGLPFELLRAEEVRRGELVRYRMLFVPGGWASNKRVALGERGCGEIRRFVEAGGSYLGICGGAGLATREEIALLPVRRKSSRQRVASYSGGIRVTTAEHPIWRGVRTPIFTAWWPSQLAIDDPSVRILAAYEEAQPEAFSSDISVENGESQGWPALEARYGILLNPGRLRGEPAVLEGRCGRGKVVLSMLHFDTPEDPNGELVLRNLWRHLTAADSPAPPGVDNHVPSGEPRPDFPQDIRLLLAEIRACVEGLIAAGQNFMLWGWRNSFLLRWRRGVRGLEYSTLFVMIREIQTLLTGDLRNLGAFDAVRLRGDLLEIRQQLVPFVDRAKHLLDREGCYLQTGSLTPLHCDDQEIESLRRDLFGSAMSHGGAFKCLIDAVDRLWLCLVRGQGRRVPDAPPRHAGGASSSSTT